MAVIDNNAVVLARAAATSAPLPPQSLDFTHYMTSPRQQGALFLTFFMPAVALVVVCLRIYNRVTSKSFGMDDSLIIAAMALSIGATPIAYITIKINYFGIHLDEIPTFWLDNDMTYNLKIQYWSIITYNPQLALVKASVCCFLLRLGGQKKSIRRSIYALNTVNITLMIIILFLCIFPCSPLQYWWDKSIDGYCYPAEVRYTVTGAITVVTDVLVLLIPIKIISGLQMTRRLKIGLGCILCVGGVVLIVSILRLVWRVQVAFYPAPVDWSWDIRFIYSAVETNLAIICASLPALYSLVSKWFPGIFKWMAKPDYPIQNGGKGYGSRGVIRTIGGSELPLSEMTSNARSKGFRSQKSNSARTSEEDLMESEGIMKTTNVNVVFDNKSIEKVRTSPNAERNTKNSASMFRYHESMKSTKDRW
ncbi:hypothetical protein N431DRAFT_487492 [Stipitochalara longipes BDJ]|nr:hypothetical protein N431DRAFT_487492 [Stipitochalara longipes BDJ]